MGGGTGGGGRNGECESGLRAPPAFQLTGESGFTGVRLEVLAGLLQGHLERTHGGGLLSVGLVLDTGLTGVHGSVQGLLLRGHLRLGHQVVHGLTVDIRGIGLATGHGDRTVTAGSNTIHGHFEVVGWRLGGWLGCLVLSASWNYSSTISSTSTIGNQMTEQRIPSVVWPLCNL